jgi:lipoate-protein ligase A
VALFDAIVLPSIGSSDLLGLEQYLLEGVASQRLPPTLVIHSMPGRIISLGRYHLYDGPERRGGVATMRRLTGGRVLGAGDGWISVALTLPSRTSMLDEEPKALKPEQVMNRYVRGLLAGLRDLGLDCFYPGRDSVTCDRREIGACSFESDASGALLFEASLGVNRGMEEVVHDLERLDPAGTLGCRMYSADNATHIARELRDELGFDRLSRALVAGYAAVLGGVARREITADELSHARRRGGEMAASGWLARRQPQAERRVVGRLASQLGAVEAQVGLDTDGTIRHVTIAGDIIANSPGLVQFERELIGQPLELASVSRAVINTYAGGKNFILGIGELDNLVKLVANAQ